VKTVFFDLDGTLTDPMLGITSSIQHALLSLDLEVPPAQELTWCIGPPLLDSLRQLVGVQLAPAALVLYRERFGDVGLFENTLYPGIPALLNRLVEAGFQLHVASSKPVTFVERIVEHFQLRGYFTEIFGAELDGTRGDKSELLSYALGVTGAHAARSIMVGDRRYDIVGAKRNEMASVGVTYGYGSREELQAAGAHDIVDCPEDIATAVC
jgi:phosphoglycolate phosphatase